MIRSSGSKSIQVPPNTKKMVHSYTQQPSAELQPSPQKERVQNCYSKNLLKNQNHIQSNILKYKQYNYQSKPTQSQSKSPDFYQLRKASASLSLVQRIDMLKLIQKKYEMFKSVKSNEIGRQDKQKLKSKDKYSNVKLQPISKTIGIKRTESKMMADQLQRFKNRKLKSRNERLETSIRQNGKLSSVRLVLSNKIRNKIIKDLITTDHEQTKVNVQNILQREDEEQWLGEFQDLKKDIERKEIERRTRHNKQLVSRSNYNNAYYQFLALEKEQKEECLKKTQKSKYIKNKTNKKQTSTTLQDTLAAQSPTNKIKKSKKLKKQMAISSSESQIYEDDFM